MNPEQKESLERASSLESIEAFKRDVEPAIIRARDTLMTRENYRSYSRNDYIYRVDVGDQVLFSMVSRTYNFEERDPARVRAAFDAELKPLGFDFREHVYEDDGRGSDTVLAWTSERYGATVHIMVSGIGLTMMDYYTGDLRSDGTSANPQELADIPGRVPDWSVGSMGWGKSWTLALRMRHRSGSMMTAPSILHSSRRRAAVKATSRSKPPEHMA